MAITVKEFCKRFTTVKDSEIATLVGKSHFTNDDIIPLNNFALCSKLEWKDFAANREGNTFINLLKGKDQIEVAKNRGTKLKPISFNQNGNNNISPNYGQNPFGQSLFTLKKAV